MTRIVKIMLMFSVGLWGVFGALSNILDFSGGLEQVKFVLSMAGAKDAAGIGWKAVHSDLLANLAFAVVYLSKLLTGLLCFYCALRLLAARKADAATFEAAKQPGILGCGISIVMLFLGFVVLAGVYFEYWRVPTYGMITHHYAFIYTMCLMSFMLFLQRPDGLPERR